MKYNGVEFEAIIATPACGKSYLCDKYPDRFVDMDEAKLQFKYVLPDNVTRQELESTKGDRKFERRMHSKEYTRCMEELFDKERANGKILIAAPHPESFDYFEKRGIRHAFVYPKEDMKEELKRRYIERGNPEAFIQEDIGMFEKFLVSNRKETRSVVKYEFGKDEYLEDILKKFGVEFD